jgi:predicted ATPase
MLAILAEQFSPLETLLFDEIENGINPEVIEKVVDALVASPKQIIVTTHSPMLLNYMSDEVAKEAVMLIYKNKDGSTHATRFFDVPSAAQKLESLPPGSAMLDVYLDQVAQEAEHHHAA